MTSVDIHADKGTQNIVEDIFESIQQLNLRISTKHIPDGELVSTSFFRDTVVRQIAPGQISMGEKVQVPKHRSIFFNLDLVAGNSESIVSNITERLAIALNNVSYSTGEFIIYGDPIYQGKGIYCVQWGLMLVVSPFILYGTGKLESVIGPEVELIV